MKTPVDTSKFEYKDMFGREIKVGDYIVYAGTEGRCAVLRAGKVLELTYSKAEYSKIIPKIKVDSWRWYNANSTWRKEETSGRQEKAVSLGFFERLIVVDEAWISEKIKKDLA